MLKAMLSSWDAGVPLQNVNLSACDEDKYTRKAYADLLHTIGQALEEWLRGLPVSSRADGEGSEQYTKRAVCVQLYDWGVWRDWWWTHIEECFPTFAKSDGVCMTYDPREFPNNIP